MASSARPGVEQLLAAARTGGQAELGRLLELYRNYLHLRWSKRCPGWALPARTTGNGAAKATSRSFAEQAEAGVSERQNPKKTGVHQAGGYSQATRAFCDLDSKQGAWLTQCY